MSTGITIEVNGEEFTDFVSAEVSLRLDALSNSFSFNATSKEGPLPFLGGEACIINVDGEKVLTGFIEVVSVTGSASDHTIRIEGRDRTGDFADSQLDVIDDLRAPISLKRIIEKVIAQLYAGETDTTLIPSVVEDTTTTDFNKAEDVAGPEPGQGAFAFAEIYMRKRQVLLTSNADGNFVIAASSGTRVPNAFIQHVVPVATGAASNANNVLSYSAKFDDQSRFNRYVENSQKSMITIFSEIASSDVVDQKTSATDADIRVGRQMVIISETPTSKSEGNKRATWEANIRKARGMTYSPTVHDFRNQAGALWAINTLIPVFSEYAGIDAEMLVNAVKFRWSRDDGSNSELEFMNSQAYTLTLDEPATEKVGVGLFG